MVATVGKNRISVVSNRGGVVGRLERRVPLGKSRFRYTYPDVVQSSPYLSPDAPSLTPFKFGGGGRLPKSSSSVTIILIILVGLSLLRLVLHSVFISRVQFGYARNLKDGEVPVPTSGSAVYPAVVRAWVREWEGWMVTCLRVRQFSIRLNRISHVQLQSVRQQARTHPFVSPTFTFLGR